MINQNDVSQMLNALRKDSVPFEVEKLRDDLASFLGQYRQLTQQERIAIRGQFGPQHGAKLLRCAQELAVRAVRNNAIDDVALGLLAVALEGVQSDFRNTVVSLCLLHHSAIKLGSNPVPLFHQAADFGTPKARDFILEYLQKGDKDIRSFAMEEGQGPNGFDYLVIAA
jgi:hypothetical protein